MQEKLAIYLNLYFDTKMTEQEALKQIQESVARLLRMQGLKANPVQMQNVAFMFQTVISQIPDKIFFSMLEDPDLKIEIRRLKPQTNEHNNAGSNKRKSP